MFQRPSSLGKPVKRRRLALAMPAPWLWLWVGVAALGFGGAQLPVTPQDAQNPAPLTDREQRQLDIFGPVVLNPSDSIDAKTRTAAATELLAMRREQANAVLLQAIRSGERTIVRSVLLAMTTAEETPVALLQGLLESVPTLDDETFDLLATELVRYGDSANAELARRARDTRLPTEDRVRYVAAMGAFRSRDGAGRLMDLLDPSRSDPQAITDAVCDSLAQLSGLGYGRNPQAWRTWWEAARSLPREEWLEQQLKQEIARISLLEKEVLKERARSDRLARELVEAHRELFRQPSFTVQQQLQRLPNLLQSDLPPLRSFAIQRIGILLQDSVPLPAEVQEGLLSCAADPDAGIRIEALTKLEEMAHPQLLSLVARTLSEERDARVVNHMLRYLARRPTAEALPALVDQLRQETIGHLAADALWALSANVDLSKLATEQLLQSLRQAHEHSPHPSFARLFALLAPDDAAAGLVHALDGEDSAMKLAIAAGFARRGRAQPLLDRAADIAIYPFATEALLRGSNDLPQFERLLKLAPPQPHVETWRLAVLRLGGRLPPSAWEQADAMLARLDAAERPLRRRFLDQCITGPAIDDAPQLRAELSRRLAALLLEINEPAEALRVLDGNGNGGLQDGSTSELRFEAAVRTGRWEQAAQVFTDAAPWIRLLERLASAQPVSARLLRDEIVRRFGDELEGDALTRFEDAVRQIPPLDATSPPDVEAAVSADEP